ncbi:MAG: hypothetical protein VX836_18360 [Pseudomonadota bacterium]|nr:hypothetical protein [Pseudomonadota bacterium]
MTDPKAIPIPLGPSIETINKGKSIIGSDCGRFWIMFCSHNKVGCTYDRLAELWSCHGPITLDAFRDVLAGLGIRITPASRYSEWLNFVSGTPAHGKAN